MADITMLQPVLDALNQFSLELAIGWLGYALALTAYGILIWHFYRFVARRDVFAKEIVIRHPGLVGIMEDIVSFALRIVKYGVFFPVISFLWFVGFAILLFVIAQQQTVSQITLIAIALISAVRIMSYYNADHARDFAKLIPLSILGVFLVQPDFFSLDELVDRLLQLPTLGTLLLHYIVYLSALELGLRVLLVLKEWIIGKNPNPIKQED